LIAAATAENCPFLWGSSINPYSLNRRSSVAAFLRRFRATGPKKPKPSETVLLNTQNKRPPEECTIVGIVCKAIGKSLKQVQQQWGKLTNDDLAQVNGRLQERYGYARPIAESESILVEPHALDLVDQAARNG
jgi:hypothetical protein